MAVKPPDTPVIPAPIWRNFKELQEWEQLHKTRPEGDKHSSAFVSITEGRVSLLRLNGCHAAGSNTW